MHMPTPGLAAAPQSCPSPPKCTHQRWQQPSNPAGAPPNAHTRAGSSPAVLSEPPQMHMPGLPVPAQLAHRVGTPLNSAPLVWRVTAATQVPSSFSSSLSLLLVSRLYSSASHLVQYSKTNLDVFFA